MKEEIKFKNYIEQQEKIKYILRNKSISVLELNKEVEQLQNEFIKIYDLNNEDINIEEVINNQDVYINKLYDIHYKEMKIILEKLSYDLCMEYDKLFNLFVTCIRKSNAGPYNNRIFLFLKNSKEFLLASKEFYSKVLCKEGINMNDYYSITKNGRCRVYYKDCLIGSFANLEFAKEFLERRLR